MGVLGHGDLGVPMWEGAVMNKREWMLHTASAAIANGLGPIGSVEVAHLSEAYDAIVAASPSHADEGWIEHRGEKPYPEGQVEVRFLDGTTDTGDSDFYMWDHQSDPRDIIAWRPAT